MAIYHYSAQIIGRSKGQSAVAAAAYRAGAILHDDRLGITHDYSRKSAIAVCTILAPPEAPDWVYDQAQLWNQVEAAEKRHDSQVAREVNVALPHELTLEQCHQFLLGFVREQYVDRGMIADVSIHDLPTNRHAHILLPTRGLDGDGFGKKKREWNESELLATHRQAWADHTNQALEQAGLAIRVDHRRLEEQGVDDRLPQIHLGPNVKAMQEKAAQKGETFEHPRWERYQAIEQFNTLRWRLQQAIEVEKDRLKEIVARMVAPEETPVPLETQDVPAVPVPQLHDEPVVAPQVSMKQLQQDVDRYAPLLVSLLKHQGMRNDRGEYVYEDEAFKIVLADWVLSLVQKSDSTLLLQAEYKDNHLRALPSQGLTEAYRKAFELGSAKEQLKQSLSNQRSQKPEPPGR